MSEYFLQIEDGEVPAVCCSELEQRWLGLIERCDDNQRDWYRALSQSEQRPQLLKALGCSQAFGDYCSRAPDALKQLQDAGLLSAPLDYPTLLDALHSEASAVADTDALAACLRRFRNRHWLRIVWRDLNRLATTAQTVAELSHLATACIEVALDYHYQTMIDEWGEPRSKEGEPQRMVVIAMGKLGANELNLSSDIDLIFAYPEAGTTEGGRRSVDNQEFFIRLGQRVIKALDALTPDGFVFRVDMRLRPYGQSGPLVVNFDALEEYYQDQGRDWERYAMIKARCVAGDVASGEQLMEVLKPFVFRRYLDFSAVEALRDMKGMIQREVQRRNLQDNIKLGPGGIREIEFIAQCFQLIRGGQEESLQARSLMTVLNELRDLEYLPAAAVKDLELANGFLRDVEHAIQAWRDQQTQQLPTDEAARGALAWAMGCPDWQSFSAELEQHRAKVAEHFANIVADPDRDSDVEPNTLAHWHTLLDELDHDHVRQQLEEAGFDDGDEAARMLVALLSSAGVQRMQSSGRERLYDFMPLLLEAASEAERPTQTLLRIIPLIESVLRRTAYLVLLMENRQALGHLVRLCDASPWIARQLAAQPVLLDELLDASSLYSVPDKDGLRSELRQRLLRIAEDDLEAQMEALRYFRLAHVLRVAASEVSGTLPLMKVSDYLTYIAEVVLESVLEIAWHNLTAKHGHFAGIDEARKHFVIVGYGKLGGLELGYGSDLDLVFIHDLPAGLATDGDRPVDGTVFFTRLGQRIIHILTTQTRLGALYEVDMRLRPSGNAGLLVSSFNAYRDYQRGQAWTWEHQALVRARVVAGDGALGEKFTELRQELICEQPRDAAALKDEVVAMRNKMRDHLLPKGSGGEKVAQFDLKQGLGGIVDIEFMVQYAVLAWSNQHPPLAHYTDNIRILETLQQQDLLPEADALALIDAYKAFRSQSHRLSLQEQKGRIADSELRDERETVASLWERLMA